MSRPPVPEAAREEFNRGSQLQDAGMLAEARACYERGLLLSPTFARGWLYLAQVHRELREYDRAVLTSRKAVELRPRYEFASLALFHSLIDAGRYTEAAAEAARFLDEVEKGAKCPVETRQMYRDWIEDTEGMATAWERHRNS